ncbi:MAG: hypothetical protein PHV33_09960 [Elusimicrobiales bacterium]|nr:hypothetical protein [Elusimicrobiales bacterium]
MKKLILAVIAAANFTAAGNAGEFGLETMSVSELKASQQTLQAVPVPVQPELLGMDRSPNQPSPVLDLTIKLPFLSLSSRLKELPGIKMQPINPGAPILFKQGENIAFSNVAVDYNGIEVEPTLLIKPVFEGENKLSIKVVKVEADIAFGPNKALPQQLDKDGLMEMVMTNLTTGMLQSMDEAFAKNKVPLRAKDVLTFSYDRRSWTLRANVNPNFIAPLMPNLISNVSLRNFTFDAEGFALSVKSGSMNAVQQPGYNLAVSDGLLDNFIAQFTKQGDFQFHPQGHEGGLKFRQDGRLEVAGKIYARDVFGKPNVYFKATILPELIGPNTLRVKVERVDVDQAYGIGIPGFINNWIQGKVIRSITETLTTNAELAKVMTATKLDDKTVRIVLKNSAFMPSFAKGAVIQKLKISNGMMYLGFEL